MLRTLTTRLLKLILVLVLLSILSVLALRWLPPPGSALMLERYWQNPELQLQRQWVDWALLPDDLKMAVIAAEDQNFAKHSGFDLAAIRAAIEHNQQGGSVRGASTISQQVAKNLFLWSSRSWLRKGLEVWFTGLIELLWPKERILEVYLNTVEWGDGIFGAEAAAQYHFKIGASYLNAQQASQLAAVLPNPREWAAGAPSDYILKRAQWIRQQSRQLGGAHYLAKLAWQPPKWWPQWWREWPF